MFHLYSNLAILYLQYWRNTLNICIGAITLIWLSLLLHSGRGSSGSGRSAAVGHSPAAERSASRAVEMCGPSPCYQVMSPTHQRIMGGFTQKCWRILFSGPVICNDYLTDWGRFSPPWLAHRLIWATLICMVAWTTPVLYTGHSFQRL